MSPALPARLGTAQHGIAGRNWHSLARHCWHRLAQLSAVLQHWHSSTQPTRHSTALPAHKGTARSSERRDEGGSPHTPLLWPLTLLHFVPPPSTSPSILTGSWLQTPHPHLQGARGDAPLPIMRMQGLGSPPHLPMPPQGQSNCDVFYTK